MDLLGKKEFATILAHRCSQGRGTFARASGGCHSRRATEKGWTLDSDQQYSCMGSQGYSETVRAGCSPTLTGAGEHQQIEQTWLPRGKPGTRASSADKQ